MAHWQGAVIVFARQVLAFLVLNAMPVANPIWLLLISAAGSAIVGGIMKLTWRQIAAIYVVAAAGQFIAATLWLQANA